ncbi:MAG: insulinase family protein [Fuerstiella sp.]|nr:insulinase family protein [Fuerstiella sp.]
MKWFFQSCLIGSCLLNAIDSLNAEDMPLPVRSIEGITEYQLDNGLRVLLLPDVSRPTVTVNLTILVGSRHEGYGEAGMAHLLEHMLFRGTPTHDDIPRLLKERGAEFNGTTWLDRTNYYETLPASEENLEFALRLEADRMINSSILKEDLDAEMTVVRSEFERGENSPFRVLMQRMTGAAFEWHNYGKSTIGNRADIERVPVENLRKFYRRFYQPDNAVLVIAGQFDAEQALTLVTDFFGAIPRPERELNQTWTEEPAQDGERLVTMRRVGDVPMAGVIYHIPAGSHPDFAAVDVMTTAMASEPSGRLYERLVKRGMAASVYGTRFALHDPGMAMFIAEAANGVESPDLLQGMVETLETVAESPFTDKQVERARQELLKRRELNVANSQGIAISLSDWAAQGDWRLFLLHRDRLEVVTAADVNRVAAAYLRRTNRTAGLFEPSESPDRTAIPWTPDLAEMIGDYQGREQIAQGEAFDPSPLAIESRLKRLNLPSDIRTTLLSKKTRGESVHLRLTLRYGNLDTLRGKATAPAFLPEMLMRGTTTRTHQDIQDELDRCRAQLSMTGEAGRLTVSLQTSRDNLPDVLSLTEDILRNSILPAEELALIKESRLATAEQRLTEPQSIASNTVQRKISPYDADDPRYHASLQEAIERIQALTIDDVREIYESLIQGKIGELTVVGDFDEDSTVSAVRQMTDQWTSETAFSRISRQAAGLPEGSFEKINTPDKANATYFSAFTLPMRSDHPDYPALIVGNYILGGGALSSRLGNRVRREEGLSYGVQSAVQASSLDPRTVFYIYAISNPQNADRVHEVIQEELEKLLKEGITETELHEQRAGLLQSRELKRTKDATLTQTLATYARAGYTMQYASDLEDQIRTLTVDDVNAAMRKHITPARLQTVIAGDFEKAGDR